MEAEQVQFQPVHGYIRFFVTWIDAGIALMPGFLFYQPVSGGAVLTSVIVFVVLSTFLGMTPCEKVFGWRVITSRGKKPGLVRTLLRSMASVVLFTININWLFLLAAFGVNRAVHDYLFGTHVVIVKK